MNCPNCQTDIKEDFGLVICPKCSAVLMVDMDGKISLSENKSELESQSEMQNQETLGNELPVEEIQKQKAAPEDPEALEGPEDLKDPEDSEYTEDITPEQGHHLDGEGASEDVEEGLREEDDQMIMEPEKSAFEGEKEPEEGEETEEDLSPLEEKEELLTQEAAPQVEENLEEKKDSKKVKTDQAFLHYSLVIASISMQETKEAIRDVLSDEKFLWNSEEMMDSIEKGTLKIQNISAIKASLLVRRIKHLDVKISWTPVGENLS